MIFTEVILVEKLLTGSYDFIMIINLQRKLKD